MCVSPVLTTASVSPCAPLRTSMPRHLVSCSSLIVFLLFYCFLYCLVLFIVQIKLGGSPRSRGYFIYAAAFLRGYENRQKSSAPLLFRQLHSASAVTLFICPTFVSELFLSEKVVGFVVGSFLNERVSFLRPIPHSLLSCDGLGIPVRKIGHK